VIVPASHVRTVERLAQNLFICAPHASHPLVVVCDVELSADGLACPKIRVLSCAQLLSETILRINRADSVSSLFADE
jgi:phosphoribosylpyrophosphate synthetase